MNLIRAAAISISALAHATLGYALARHVSEPAVAAFEKGEGEDFLTVEQGIAVEDNIVKVDEPPPPDDQEERPPEQVQTVAQPQQVAILTEQSSGEVKVAGDATARAEYLGKLRNVLERAKVNPRSRYSGTVVVKFKVSTDGQLMWREVSSSSGSKTLDDAALAALDRAAPFPTMPAEVADEPLVVSVPFKFITR